MKADQDPLRVWRRQVWWRRLARLAGLGFVVALLAVLYTFWPETEPLYGQILYPTPDIRDRSPQTPASVDPVKVVNEPLDTGGGDEASWVVHLDDLVDEINDWRRQGAWCGRWELQGRALVEAPALSAASQSHARWMIETDEYGHVSEGNPEGDDPTRRARYFGFTGVVAENIAWGQRTPDEVVRWWLNSRDHCPILMDPEARWLGIAVEPDPETQGWVWVMMTGS
jgi:hypothetical protein